MISPTTFNDRYPTRRLGEVVEFLDNQRRPVKESERTAGQYPYYGANGQLGTINDYIFDEPLVLLAEDGGFFDNPDRGVAYQINGKTWVNNHAHVLRAGADLIVSYLSRVLENYDVSPFISGTTRAKLTKEGASRIEIPLPPLPEQRRIAAILDQAEALRAKRRRALARLDALTQSIFIEMFGGEPPRDDAWPMRRLAEVCESIADIDHNMPKATNAGYPFISAKDLTEDGDISFRNVKRISEADFLRLSRKTKPRVGDIIYSRIGAIGRASLVRIDTDFLASYSCCTIRPNRELIEPLFLRQQLVSPRVMRQALKGVRAIAVPDLGLGEIKSFQIAVPPLELQRRFCELQNGLDGLKSKQSQSLEKLAGLFASLQHRAFRGEL